MSEARTPAEVIRRLRQTARSLKETAARNEPAGWNSLMGTHPAVQAQRDVAGQMLEAAEMIEDLIHGARQ